MPFFTERTNPEAPSGNTADVPALARRYEALLQRRAPWDEAWQSLADHFLPTRCRLNPQTDATEEGPMGLVVSLAEMEQFYRGDKAGQIIELMNKTNDIMA